MVSASFKNLFALALGLSDSIEIRVMKLEDEKDKPDHCASHLE